MGSRFIDVYTQSGEPSIFDITPASVKREWMDETFGHAYKCLPLKIANQYGWVAHSPCTFTATWDGGTSKDSLLVQPTGEDFCDYMCAYAVSHFAHGILTVNTDFLIRTTPGTSLYVRGLTNHQKDVIYPMDAVIETDWLPFHFPFSYRFIKPGTITFKKGEPLFMFFPIEREYIESFSLNFKSMDSNPELQEQNRKFSESRARHMAEGNPLPQKFYIKGTVVDEKAEIAEHRVKLRLAAPEELLERDEQ